MVARQGGREQDVGDRADFGAAALVLALALAGCRERATVARAPSAPPPAAQGPVNPDAGVTAYACLDGQAVTAGYPDPQTAVVTYQDHAYTLKRAPSADGERYTGYGLQWWTRGAHATIARLEPGEEAASAAGVECAAQGQPPVPSVTRTDYRP